MTATTASAWDAAIGRLAEFVTEHGHARVPRRYRHHDGFALGVWVVGQRLARRGSDTAHVTPLDDAQVARLDALSFDWAPPIGRPARHDGKPNRTLPAVGVSVSEQAWRDNLRRLDEYVAEHGDGEVPVGYVHPDGFRLGAWVAQAVTNMNGSATSLKLTATRIAQLEQRGVRSGSRNPRRRRYPSSDAAWKRNLERLDEFIAEHGHALVPTRYRAEDGSALGSWVANVRSARRGTDSTRRLTPAGVESLDRRGFVWDPPAAGRRRWSQSELSTSATCAAHSSDNLSRNGSAAS